MSLQPDIDKTHLCTKISSLTNKRESTRLKHLNDFEVFIEYSIDMDDIYKLLCY